jgi:hypothetical protein
MIAAMDFSLARSIASLIRPSNVRAGQAIVLGGFVLRFGAIVILLWTLSRTSDVNFLAVCIGLIVTFTALTVWQGLRSLINAGRERKQLTNGR